MDFRGVVLAAVAKHTPTNADQKKAVALAKKSGRPLLWEAIEHCMRVRYQRVTGKLLPASFDWSTILTWIIANLPTILSLILTLFVI